VTQNSPPVSDAELAVLKVLWKSGPGTVREIDVELRKKRRRWAYNTVLTLLSRLREKGYVASEKQGVAHLFEATVTREELLKTRLSELADSVCDGTKSPLVHALVEGSRFSAKEIAELRQLLNKLEDKKKRK